MAEFTLEQMDKIVEIAEGKAVLNATSMYRPLTKGWYDEYYRAREKEITEMITPPQRKCQECGK